MYPSNVYFKTTMCITMCIFNVYYYDKAMRCKKLYFTAVNSNILNESLLSYDIGY